MLLSYLLLLFAHAATAISSAAPPTRAEASRRGEGGGEEGETEGVGGRTSRVAFEASFVLSSFFLAPALLTGAGGSSFLALASPPPLPKAHICLCQMVSRN